MAKKDPSAPENVLDLIRVVHSILHPKQSSYFDNEAGKQIYGEHLLYALLAGRYMHHTFTNNHKVIKIIRPNVPVWNAVKKRLEEVAVMNRVGTHYIPRYK